MGTKDLDLSIKENYDLKVEVYKQNDLVRVGDLVRCPEFPYDEFSEVIRIESMYIVTSGGKYIKGDNFLEIKYK